MQSAGLKVETFAYARRFLDGPCRCCNCWRRILSTISRRRPFPFDNMDAEYLARPRKWEAPDIGRSRLFIGPIRSLFDYSTFALMWFVFYANAPEHQLLLHVSAASNTLARKRTMSHVQGASAASSKSLMSK
jgi:hypothetical protein